MQSSLNPLPAKYLKKVSGDVACLLAHIFNRSFENGYVPSKFKNAVITPLLKKAELDVDDPSNFRPISNVSLTSKILQCLVWSCLDVHLNQIGTMPLVQSAYQRKPRSLQYHMTWSWSQTEVMCHSGATRSQCGVRHNRSWHPTSASTYKSPHQWSGARLVHELSYCQTWIDTLWQRHYISCARRVQSTARVSAGPAAVRSLHVRCSTHHTIRNFTQNSTSDVIPRRATLTLDVYTGVQMFTVMHVYSCNCL